MSGERTSLYVCSVCVCMVVVDVASSSNKQQEIIQRSRRLTKRSSINAVYAQRAQRNVHNTYRLFICAEFNGQPNKHEMDGAQ